MKRHGTVRSANFLYKQDCLLGKAALLDGKSGTLKVEKRYFSARKVPLSHSPSINRLIIRWLYKSSEKARNVFTKNMRPAVIVIRQVAQSRVYKSCLFFFVPERDAATEHVSAAFLFICSIGFSVHNPRCRRSSHQRRRSQFNQNRFGLFICSFHNCALLRIIVITYQFLTSQESSCHQRCTIPSWAC